MDTRVQCIVATALISLAGGAMAQGLGGAGVPAAGSGLRPPAAWFDSFVLRGWAPRTSSAFDGDARDATLESPLRSGLLLLADWHFGTTGFRLSGGLGYGSLRLDAATPLNMQSNAWGSISSYGALDGVSSWSRVNPYLGVGWGRWPNAKGGLYFSADVGVALQRPSSVWAGQCQPTFGAALCRSLSSEARYDDDSRSALDELRVFPRVSVGVGLRF